MILAAGRGERLRPWTDTTPKPLLRVGGKALIDWTLERLHRAGYRDVVINVSHLAQQIVDHCSRKPQRDMRIRFSEEPSPALETAGGIQHALELLGAEPFLVVNGDIWCDHDLRHPGLAENRLGHLVLVPNPEHHPEGDFSLENDRLGVAGIVRHTFAGIAWYRPEFFARLEPGRRPLAPMLREAARAHQLAGNLHAGTWIDVGTPERLAQVDRMIRAKA